ncbi:hypothetical protein [Gorillibacterium sp. sgz5001074]|uniref:hypothetical protein n=1 Tax=Gorillibacterium sp. sgz5001074 TaxID=3446695 RepID=UPI003F67211A
MKKLVFHFVAAGLAMTLVFLFVINLVLSPGIFWFFYPGFGVLIALSSFYFGMERKLLAQAVSGSILLASFLILENLLISPTDTPWFLYAVFPLIWWPVSVGLGSRAGTPLYAWTASFITVGYYLVLNVALSPGHPWIIYILYALLWWPASIHYSRKRGHFGFSLFGSGITILLLAVVNAITTPREIWVIYPAFTLVWWPLSMYYFVHRRKKAGI